MSEVINFKYYSQDFYVGLFAFDKFGISGDMSNVVLVNMPAPPASTVGTLTEQPAREWNTVTDWTLIGAIIGSVAVLLLFLIVQVLQEVPVKVQQEFLCQESEVVWSKGGDPKSSAVRVDRRLQLRV